MVVLLRCRCSHLLTRPAPLCVGVGLGGGCLQFQPLLQLRLREFPSLTVC